MAETPPDKPPIPRAPTGLQKAGRALWKAIHGTFGFADEPHLVEILEQACKVRDRIADLEVDLQGQPSTVAGSAGQLIAHPLIPEIRFQQKALAELIGKLGLPDNSVTETVSDRMRRTANARWK